MPTVYRFAKFLACAVLFAASLHSAPTLGFAQGILDVPIGADELQARQKARVRAFVKRRHYASEVLFALDSIRPS